MAYCNSIQQDGISRLQKNIETQKDVLFTSINAMITKCLADIQIHGSNNLKTLTRILEWHLKTLISLNEYFNLRYQNLNEDDDSSTSESIKSSLSDSEKVDLLPQPLPIPLKSQLVMKVSCFNSIKDFWLQLSSGQTRKDALSALLKRKLKSESLLEALDIKSGQLVIVETTCGVIRALVLKKFKRGRIQVLDIDSGIEASTTCKAYEPDQESLANYQQAVHCKLSTDDGLCYVEDREVRRLLCSGDLNVTFEKTVPDKYLTYSVFVNTSKVAKSGIDSFQIDYESLAYNMMPSKQSERAHIDKEFPALGKQRTNVPSNEILPNTNRIVKSEERWPKQYIKKPANEKPPNSNIIVKAEENLKWPKQHNYVPSNEKLPNTNRIGKSEENLKWPHINVPANEKPPNSNTIVKFEANPTWPTPSYTAKPIVRNEDNINHKSITSNKEKQTLKFFDDTDDSSSIDMSITSESTSAIKSVLREGEEYDILITHIVSPGEMYARIINCTEIPRFESLQENMNAKYSHPSRPHLSALKGNAVACFSLSDNQWVRGVIKDIHYINSKGNEVVVYLIDYGDTIIVPERLCANLLPEFQILPALAHSFSLAMIFPISPCTEWSSQVISELKNMLDPHTLMKLNIVSEADNESTYPTAVLSFFPDKSGNEEVVNISMVQKGLASSNAPELDDSAVMCPKLLEDIEEEEQLNNWDPMSEHFFSGDNGELENVNIAVTGYDPQDEKQICYLFSKTGKCDRLGCRKKHTTLNPDGWTTDKEIVYTEAFNELATPEPGTTCRFSLTGAKSTTEMFAILSDENLSSWNNPDGHGDINELTENINKGKEVQNSPQLKILPCEEQIVLSKCKEFGDLYYRAKVLEVVQDPDKSAVPVKVLYVDYGTIEWVELKMLRYIQPKFLHLPFMAVEIFVTDLEVKTGYLKESRQIFMDLANNEEITADVESVQSGKTVFWRLNVSNIRFGKKSLKKVLGKRAFQPEQLQILTPADEYFLPM